ncbi:MAG TPA: DUF998 domain-containing protein [Chitinophagaceae bacterium]|nr:DUF998 domain-containing protein [Chitinophagaceae bacterium]
MRRFLLYCGVLAALLYIAMNIFTPFFYKGYNWITQTVSELSAVDAPTRSLWFPFGIAYTLLVAAFGLGILKVSGEKRSLRIVGILMILHGLLGLAWSPMHQREVLAAGGGTFTDTWHLVMSGITVLLMFLSIGFGSAALGKAFRYYSIATILVFIVFGVLTFLEAPNVDKNLPTPFIGLWERINIAAFMVWMIMFASILLKAERKASPALVQREASEQKQLFNKTNTQINKPVY